MENVAADGHLQTTGQGFEDAFGLMMFIFAMGFDAEIHGSSIAQTLEKVNEHLSWHVAYSFTGRPPKSSATVQRQSSIGRV